MSSKKKTDEKQDAVIAQLRANQLALTDGLRDFAETNRDVLTLKELPFPGAAGPPAKSPPVKSPTKKNYELNSNFSPGEMLYIKRNGLVEPNELLKLGRENLNAMQNHVMDERNHLSQKIGAFKRIKNPDITDRTNNANAERDRNILNKYLDAIKDAAASAKYKTGTGVRKYKQPKRNAYKISDSLFGNLSVDVPRLKNEMKLNVFRGGKLIYHADADKSLVDLLTKRFNPKRSYSMNAVKIFNDLNVLANLPRHPSSGKSKLIGSGVVYYNDPNELAERMKILVGSMAAGNNSPVIKNDLAMINDEFLKIGAIDKTIHEKFYKKYIK